MDFEDRMKAIENSIQHLLELALKREQEAVKQDEHISQNNRQIATVSKQIADVSKQIADLGVFTNDIALGTARLLRAAELQHEHMGMLLKRLESDSTE